MCSHGIEETSCAIPAAGERSGFQEPDRRKHQEEGVDPAIQGPPLDYQQAGRSIQIPAQREEPFVARTTEGPESTSGRLTGKLDDDKGHIPSAGYAASADVK
jgi:hypothetical protein